MAVPAAAWAAVGPPAARALGLVRAGAACRASAPPLPRRQLATRATMEGRSVLVTGATDGIGEHTAKNLARAGATVLVHGRNMPKAQNAADRIQAAAGRSGRVQPFAADLSSIKEVHQLASAVKQAFPKIDVLVNNAGVFAERAEKSVDGNELTWAVNVVAPYLLTGLLLDNVTERIVNVSSISAGSSIDFANLNQERRFSSHNAYSLSKLASQIFTAELAARMAGTQLAINCLDPGTVNTKMLYAGWGPCGMSLSAANDLTALVTQPSFGKVTGKFFVGQRDRRMNGPANDASVRRRLWSTLEEQTGFKYQ